MCHELQHHPAATNMARLSRALHQCAVLPPLRKSRELVLDWLAAVQATAPRRQLPIRSSWPSRWSNAPRPRACPRSRATSTSLSASVPVQWRGRFAPWQLWPVAQCRCQTEPNDHPLSVLNSGRRPECPDYTDNSGRYRKMQHANKQTTQHE